MPGVRINVSGHPELGQTLSRQDGWFDMAVNGGGLLTVSYEKAGLLPAQAGMVPRRPADMRDEEGDGAGHTRALSARMRA